MKSSFPKRDKRQSKLEVPIPMPCSGIDKVVTRPTVRVKSKPM